MNKRSPESAVLCFIIVLVVGLLPFTAHRTSVHAQTRTLQTSLTNPDFEQGKIGQIPEGWFSPTAGAGYSAELVEQNTKSGKRAALISSVATPPANPAPFGNLMQMIDATSMRGHRIRLRAAVRIEGNPAFTRAQLWMRVDRPNQQMGFFDNMNDRPVTSRDWQYYEITGDIADDATVINVGMMLMGQGKAWLDDVSLTDLGKPTVLAEPARPLTNRGLENLIAFTRLLGYVRHFYPGDEAAAADWNAFAVEGVRVAEQATDANDLAQKLETLFSPLAPNVRVFPTGKRPTPINVLTPGNAKVISYRHTGFVPKNAGPNIYHSERVTSAAATAKGLANPQSLFTADLGGGVSVAMPLALYVDALGTLPHAATSTKSTPQLSQYSGNDRSTRLADVALAWNVFQHFYPYFDVVKTDWPRELRDALTSAANDADQKAFHKTLRRMVAALHDGHGNVVHASEVMAEATPVIFDWVENQLVITQTGPGANGLQAGDIVLKIDGKNAAEGLAEAETLISGATPQWRRAISLRRLRIGPVDSELKLEVQPRSGESRVVVLKRDAESLKLTETRPPQVSEIKPGVYYVDLDRIKDEDFQAILPKLEQARGIVFDVRGYPKVSPVVISHLIDKPVESPRWLIPIITVPDRQGPATYDERGRWSLQPMAPRLKAKIAFITGGGAISYAESFMGIVEAYKLGEIVGEPTAGTNGNVNPFILPGGYTVVWTGMKVLKHDGSTHHGVGIKPTIPVSRTIAGVAAGRDEQLERAIAFVSQ